MNTVRKQSGINLPEGKITIRLLEEHLLSAVCALDTGVYLYRPYRVDAIDREGQTATIVSENDGSEIEIVFKHIFCCGGSRRPVLNLIPDHPIRFHKLAQELPQKHIAITEFTISNPHGFVKKHTITESFLKILESTAHMPDPDETGKSIHIWPYPYLPTIICRRIKKNCCCVVYDIPPAIMNELNKERQQRLLLLWGQTLVSWFYRNFRGLDLSPDDCKKRHMDQSIAITDLSIDFASNPTFPLNESGAHLTVIGDACFPVYFKAGNGTKSGFQQAMLVPHYLSEDFSWDADGYTADVARLRRVYTERMRLLVKEKQLDVDSQMNDFFEAQSWDRIDAEKHDYPDLVINAAFDLLRLIKYFQKKAADEAMPLYFMVAVALRKIVGDMTGEADYKSCVRYVSCIKELEDEVTGKDECEGVAVGDAVKKHTIAKLIGFRVDFSPETPSEETGEFPAEASAEVPAEVHFIP